MPEQIDINEKATPDVVAEEKQGTEAQQDVKLVLSLFEQDKRARTKYDRDWQEHWDYYNGRQWKGGRAKHRAAPVMNICYTTVQTQLPILTDARPGFNVLPADPSDYETADMLSHTCDNWWDNAEMDHTLVEVLTDAKVMDAGVLKAQWDPEAADGAGDIICDIRDLRNIFVPHDARDFTKHCGHVIERLYKPVGELRRKFPKVKDLIKPDNEKEQKEYSQANYGGETTLVSPIDRKVSGVDNPPQVGVDDRKTATVFECWIKDESIEEFYEEHKDGATKRYRKKYPYGKLIYILPNRKVLLWSGPSPYRHARWPYVRFIDKLVPRQFYGDGEMRVLKEMQNILNKVLANILDYSTLCSNPVWKVPIESDVDPENITNKTGLVICGKGEWLDKIKRDIPPAMQAGALEMLNQIMRLVEAITGMSDVTQGRRPTGITAAQAIDELQEAAHTRIRLQERNNQVSIGQLGKLVIMLMMQYYTSPRIAKITGKQGWPEYFSFFFEDLGDGQTKVTRQNFDYDEKNKRYAPTPQVQTSETAGIFDVKVLSGSSLPFVKSKRGNQAMRLFELGAIDREGLMDALEWPKKEELLKRMQEQDAMQVMQAQEAQGAVQK